MQLVVVMAVRKAVRAATTTFTAISMKRFFIFYTPFRLTLRQLLRDPVIQRRNLLDVGLLLGILLLGSQVDLLLHTVGAQRALVLEGTRGDVVISSALGTEADVDTLHVGLCVPLSSEQVGLGDALLGALHRGPEDTQTVDLHGVALSDQLDHTRGHLGEHTLDDVARVHSLVLSHVLGQTSERDRLLLYGLRVILTVPLVVRVDVLTNVD